MSAALRRALLAWYERNRRDLPWRRTRDPYRVWVSEVMLQQTTVKTVARRTTRRFLERFPTLAALAAAARGGRRSPPGRASATTTARATCTAARATSRERHAGRFPRTLEAALAVPGVGLYTASAVLSIAHGQPLPVVDGNVRRVLGAAASPCAAPSTGATAPFYNRAEELLDRERPGDWNQALMELGATVCLPRKPACRACPLRAALPGAAAGHRGRAAGGPRPRARRST